MRAESDRKSRSLSSDAATTQIELCDDSTRRKNQKNQKNRRRSTCIRGANRPKLRGAGARTEGRHHEEAGQWDGGGKPPNAAKDHHLALPPSQARRGHRRCREIFVHLVHQNNVLVLDAAQSLPLANGNVMTY